MEEQWKLYMKNNKTDSTCLPFKKGYFNCRNVSEIEISYFDISSDSTMHNAAYTERGDGLGTFCGIDDPDDLDSQGLPIRNGLFVLQEEAWGIYMKYVPNPSMNLYLEITGIQTNNVDKIRIDITNKVDQLWIQNSREDPNREFECPTLGEQRYSTTSSPRAQHPHNNQIIYRESVPENTPHPHNNNCFQCPDGWVANTANTGCEKLLCATTTDSRDSMHKCYYKEAGTLGGVSMDDGDVYDNAGFLSRVDGASHNRGVTLKDKCLGTDPTNPNNANWPYYDISSTSGTSGPSTISRPIKDIHGASCCRYITNNPGLDIYSNTANYNSHWCTHSNDYLTRKTTLSLLPGNILEKEHYFGQEIHNGSTMWEDEDNTKPFMDPISYDMIIGNVSKVGELIQIPNLGGKINRTICNYSDNTRLRTEEEIIYDGNRTNARHKYVMVYEKVNSDELTDSEQDLPYSFLNTKINWPGIIVYWKIDISPIIYKEAFNSRFRMYRATVEKLPDSIRHANDATENNYYKYAGSLLGEILGKLQDEIYESTDSVDRRNCDVGRKLEWMHGSSKTLKREYQLLAENPIFDQIS